MDGNGTVSLMRYTDRINPETPTSPTSPSDHENVYSTLNRAEMDTSLPPPPPFHPADVEMENLRKNSRSLLLGDMVDGGKTSSMPFQIVEDGIPEPYQVAVSSREDLCNIGRGVGGKKRSTSSQGALNGGRYESDHQVRQLTHTLCSGAVPPPRGIGSNISATNPLVPYEQIDRRYGVNDFSDSTTRDTRSGTLPVRASSGHVMRGMPPGVVPGTGFRRYTSAIESSGFASTDSMDYTRLNRGEGRGPIPAPLNINPRGGRGASVSSLTPSHQTHQLPRLEKSHSVTNYSRGSPSSADTVDITKPPLNFTPTSEGPPPYREAALSYVSSPYTPSESSSLLENGAYEGVASPPPTTSAHGVVVMRESLKTDDHIAFRELEEQPWYHNTSDFSIHMNDHQSSHQDGLDTGEPGVPPYSLAGNLEGDSQRRVGGSSGSIDTRFSLPNNEPFPYSNSVDRSVESLSRVPRPPNTHFHTVVV